MKFYRVSQDPIRKIGEEIWETGNTPLYAELRRATDTFITAIRENDQEYIANVFKDEQMQNKFTGSFMEAVWEYVRQTEFPDLPNRYQNMMVFEKLEDARAFNKKYRKGKGIIYEIEIKDPKYFEGDMNILNRMCNYDLDHLKEIFREYWQGKATESQLWEVVLYPEQRAIIVKIL